MHLSTRLESQSLNDYYCIYVLYQFATFFAALALDWAFALLAFAFAFDFETLLALAVCTANFLAAAAAAIFCLASLAAVLVAIASCCLTKHLHTLTSAATLGIPLTGDFLEPATFGLYAAQNTLGFFGYFFLIAATYFVLHLGTATVAVAACVVEVVVVDVVVLLLIGTCGERPPT